MKIRYRKPFRHPPEKEVSWDSWGSPEEAAAAQIVTQWQTPQWQAGTGAILPSHGGLRICVHFGSTLPWKRQLRKTSEPTRNTQDLFLRILREDSGRFWKTDEDWWRLCASAFATPESSHRGFVWRIGAERHRPQTLWKWLGVDSWALAKSAAHILSLPLVLGCFRALKETFNRSQGTFFFINKRSSAIMHHFDTRGANLKMIPASEEVCFQQSWKGGRKWRRRAFQVDQSNSL